MRTATGGASYGYEGAKNYAQQKGFNGTDIRPHVLIHAKPLLRDNPVYEYLLTQEVPAELQRSLFSLPKNDGFYCTGTGVAVARVPVQKSANGDEKLMFGNAKFYYFADKAVFQGAAPQPNASSGWATEAEAVENVYGGKMKIEVEDSTICDNLSTAVFETVPFTQTGATQINATPKINCKDLGKPFGFFGDKDSKVTITLGNGDYLAIAGDTAIAAGTVGYRNFLVLIQNGFLIRKAAAGQRIAG